MLSKLSNKKFILLSVLTLILLIVDLVLEIKTLSKTQTYIFWEFRLSLLSLAIKTILILLFLYSHTQIRLKFSRIYRLPLLLCLISLSSSLCIALYFHHRENSTVILSARFDGGTNGINLFLRENKTYKIDNFSHLGGESYYGNYNIKGNFILLDDEHPKIEKNKLFSTKMIIEDGYVLIKPTPQGEYRLNAGTPLKVKYSKF